MPTAEEIEAQKAGRVQVRKAPANELRRMRVQEVGLVPFGANARVFPIVKADGDSSMKIKMSGQAQKTALGALQELSEKIASTAAIANAAEVDDAAPPPAELGKIFAALGESALGLAKQYCGPGAMADDEEKKKAAALEAEKAARPFPGAAPPFGKKKPEEDDGEEAKKAADCIVTTLKTIQKAGKKMAKSRLDALKGAHEAIGKLLAEVDDAPESEQPGGALGKALAGIVAKIDALSAAAVAKSDETVLTVKSVEEIVAKSGEELIAKLAAGKGAPTRVLDSNASGAGRTEAGSGPGRSLIPYDLRELTKPEYAHLDPKDARR